MHVAVILAAGLGTRMKSALPKAAQKIGGRAMLSHLIATCADVFDRVVVVIGPDMPMLEQLAVPHKTIVQIERLGTAHAAFQAAGEFGDGMVGVFYADNPLVSAETMQKLVTRAEAGDAGLVLLGMVPPEAGAYGRIVEEAGYVLKIVEHTDADEPTREIRLCNAGGMVAGAKAMRGWLQSVQPANAKGEYYLTDIVGIARTTGVRVAAIVAPYQECIGVNSRRELADAETVLQARLREQALNSGVAMIAPETVFFSHDTKLATDVTIGPYVVFGPGVSVQSGAEIRAFSHLEGCVVGTAAVVGPYARLRPGAIIGEAAHVGNFVEIKAAELGAGAKVNHLSYIGDAEIGAATNIGAGTITCNYDGKAKHKTRIGARAFIGSNTALVAPVSVGDEALVAAGSTITQDVPAGRLAVARGRQINKEKRQR